MKYTTDRAKRLRNPTPKLTKEQKKELYQPTRFGMLPGQPDGLTFRQRESKKEKYV